jgi:predicted nucleic acid-binding Zn ribbon protein
MFCPKCGKEVPEDSSFCPNCGYHLMPEIPETKTEEKNSYLVTLLAVGVVTLFLSFKAQAFVFITFIIVIISTVTVYTDAKAIGVGRGFNKEILGETVTWKPITWSLLVFFFWIIFLPLYLVKRRVLLERD